MIDKTCYELAKEELEKLQKEIKRLEAEYALIRSKVEEFLRNKEGG